MVQEYLDGIPELEGPKARARLRRRIAEKYGITHAMVQGIVENAATEGLVRNPGGGFRDGQGFHPINYHELARGRKRTTNEP